MLVYVGCTVDVCLYEAEYQEQVAFEINQIC